MTGYDRFVRKFKDRLCTSINDHPETLKSAQAHLIPGAREYANSFHSQGPLKDDNI